jgi:hypothetical protein
MSKLMLEHSGLSSSEKILNLIDVPVNQIQVQQAGFWKKKDTSKIKDYKEYEANSDWTFSTPYKGTIRYLNGAAKRIFEETNLSIEFDKEKACDTLSASYP